MDKIHILSKSPVVEAIPLACCNETAAVEFLEKQRWGNTPACVKCGSVDVYKMTDSKTGERNKRFLWRCHDCKEQYTVRIGTVYEESRIELRHWCYAFWRAATSKKGISALELKRQCQISYKSALFLMNRIRFAMAPDPKHPKLTGTVEVDETYIGPRKLRYPGTSPRGNGTTSKVPVFCAVQRDGQIRRRIIANVNGYTLKAAIREEVDSSARIMSDENNAYYGLDREFASHQTVCHSTKEYARGEVHSNTAESSHALVKRGIVGIYHSISKEYLHRYLWQYDFLWNNRQMNDGERTIAAIKGAEGKRLTYKEPMAQQQAYTEKREQEKSGAQLKPF
jgi:transposase-like protein